MPLTSGENQLPKAYRILEGIANYLGNCFPEMTERERRIGFDDTKNQQEIFLDTEDLLDRLKKRRGELWRNYESPWIKKRGEVYSIFMVCERQNRLKNIQKGGEQWALGFEKGLVGMLFLF